MTHTCEECKKEFPGIYLYPHLMGQDITLLCWKCLYHIDFKYACEMRRAGVELEAFKRKKKQESLSTYIT